MDDENLDALNDKQDGNVRIILDYCYNASVCLAPTQMEEEHSVFTFLSINPIV